MGMCLIIAVIAATAGISNAILDAKRIVELEAELNEIRPAIKIVPYPSTYVKPNGEVCLTLTWVKSRNSDANIVYTWSADIGTFEPSGRTELAQAKWIAPEDIPPTTIKIYVRAIDTETQSLIGVGEDKIGIISSSTTGQPEVPSGNC